MGLGKFSVMPGTFGTLAGIPPVLVLGLLDPCWSVPVIVAAALIAAWVADEAERILGRKDPGCVVIDEVVGLMVTLVGVPLSAGSILAGFLLFRAFDILKPPPVRYFDRHFQGGAGIVLDDLAAGLYGALALRLVLWIQAVFTVNN
jgi:phosphatidylglycerophosphatase A